MKFRHLIISLLCLVSSFLFLSFFIPSMTQQMPQPQQTQKNVWVGILIGNNDRLVPLFLKSIEKIDYDKSSMYLQIDLCNTSSSVKKTLLDWIQTNKQYYLGVQFVDHEVDDSDKERFIEKNKLSAHIKDGYLVTCHQEGFNHCFILSSDVLLAPHTLKYLIEKDKPIVSALLRPLPQANDPYRNFFGDVNEWGYYKHHENYMAIANRQKIGTFQVPCVHGVYLIQAPFLHRLSFTKNFRDYECIAFSSCAREENIDQFICNEREFGFLIHLKDGVTLEEERNFSLIGMELEITPLIYRELLKPYLKDDCSLEEFVQRVDLNQYQIYRVNNQDLFFVDEINDYIKSYTIKQGANWEEHFYPQFQKYVKPGTVVLDIGGHIGTHTLALSKIVGNEGVVYSFEPQAKVFTELVVNMYLNKCNNVRMFHKALGANQRWAAMHIPKEHWHAWYAPNLVNEGHGTISLDLEQCKGDRVQIVKLDDFHLENVSFIKMDVEGFEMEVVAGGLETIQKNKPIMIIEIFNNPQRHTKIQTIEDLGYASSNLSGDDYLFIPLEQLGLTK